MRASRAWVGGVVAIVAIAAIAACAKSAPTRDEVVVAIDTDAPVPGWVDRVRVEIFDATGTTAIDAHDYALPDPSDWPLSFGVHPGPTGATSFRLRIRAYNSARPISGWQRVVLGDNAPDGPEAYDALTTIDRAALLDVGHGSSRASIVLRSECFGVPSDVAAGRACVDGAAGAIALSPEPLAPSTDPAAASLVGSWPRVQSVACSAAPRSESGTYDEELCIPGGAYVMGDRDTEHILPGLHNAEGAPERIVQMSPFLLDRYEVSVARFRAAVNDPTRPFVPPTVPSMPKPGEGYTCGTQVNYRFCNWRGASAASDANADALPMNCITQETARAFCQWAGGDLPTEAQWEYAATQAFREIKGTLPWVGASPSCDIAVYGRFSASIGADECGREAVCGPLRVDAPFGAGPRAADCGGLACVRDETPGPNGRGIVGLGGNVAEWVRDADIPYTDPCWQSAPRLDPVCDVPGVKDHMYRGGSWLTASWLLTAVLRSGGIDENPLLAQYGAVGFRCARPGISP
jgi:formylglycine-generating enzyme required for sulfatase activity